MPGKVNPVIPEVVSQVAYLVIGHDLTVTMCAEGGQLQLNAFEPTIAFCIMTSLRMLTSAVESLTNFCIRGITANRAHCLELVNNSIGLVTALGPRLGYEASSRVAKRALKEGRGVREIVLEEGLLSVAELDELLRIEAMTRPSRMITAGSVSSRPS
jgi:aspartate ammonia-lyase